MDFSLTSRGDVWNKSTGYELPTFNSSNVTDDHVLILESPAVERSNNVLLENTNTTWNYSGRRFSNNTDEELFEPSIGIIVLLSVLYGTISVITVIGNFLVILVIIKNKTMHTVTNFYIANLSVADVMIGIFSIPFQFQAALLQRWDLPHLLCPVAPFVKQMTVNVSIITLTVISIDRFFAVIHPLRPRSSKRIAKIVMSVVWIFSIGSSLPSALTFRVKQYPYSTDDPALTKPFCSQTFPAEQEVQLGKLYRIYLAIIQYFFPLIIICYAYFRIMHKIWFSRAPGSAMDSRDQMLNKNKRKVIKMLIIVVALFAFCWLPLQTYNLLAEIDNRVNLYRYINIIWFCSNWLAMSNSCYNPFIYGLLNEKFKHGFRLLFIKWPCVKKDKFYPEAFVTEHSEESVRRASCAHEDTRFQVNGGRVKRYMRVCGGQDGATETSFV